MMHRPSTGRRIATVVTAGVLGLAPAQAGAPLPQAVPTTFLSQMLPGDPPELRRAAVWTVVRGIIGYTRWPVQPAPVRLCIVGPSEVASDWADRAPGTDGRPVAIRAFAVAGPAMAGACDAIYVGGGPAAVPAAVAAVAGHPVLSIAEDDRQCRGGTMFCLHLRQERPSFQLNLDAVARSGTRIHPNVLKLARPAGGEP